MRKTKSCGFIVMRKQPQISFLLMHKKPGTVNIYDIPKGHIEFGENEVNCALRELSEETGILLKDIDLDTNFRYTETYQTKYKRFKGEKVEKTLVIFLGWLKNEVDLKLTEHYGSQWVEWNPPHIIQEKTINPLLEQLNKYLII
ncbi:NTP pyrophosphohydrolase [Rivularia sp. PCC 7116]|uniref:bis(5'-nucleosyl)-tetraphosphatase n=1 Tax=Rivularia sp. PCC 7116 TaxID=373994 RepID=UPI00029F1DAB|nr:NUDIX domain-containing protein [Rivularia sp. PCC 7116]AFY58759.1 NTP pyrophosphohydrolase [Rivularia sp. PCC 7116]